MRYLFVVAALVLVLPLMACGGSDSESGSESSAGSGSAGSESSDSLPVVRFQGLSDGMSAISLKVIELQGFDKKNGFKGEFQYIPADSSTQNFLLGKSDFDLDAGPPDLAVAASKDYDVVSFTAAAKNHVVVVAPNDSPYQNMEDLKGKTIGWFGSDSTAALTIQMLLGEKGIDFFNDYKFAQAAPSALVPLLKSGQVDAIVTFQPWASWANSQVEGGVRTVFDPNAAWQENHPDGTIWTTIGAAHRKWIEQNPDLVAKAEKAWCDAAEYMNANMKEIVQEPEVQELLDPVKPETGLNTMAEYVQDNQMFQCGWTEAQTKDVNAFLDQIADQGKLFKQNPGDLFAPLEELTG
ncbi:MAG TPA: ABC transporter substrate-binding protein [Solirubrobacter sp.]|nr:ABC transporter substrate-binding protein [Solirubrobacter sp.]